MHDSEELGEVVGAGRTVDTDHSAFNCLIDADSVVVDSPVDHDQIVGSTQHTVTTAAKINGIREGSGQGINGDPNRIDAHQARVGIEGVGSTTTGESDRNHGGQFA